MDAFGCLFLPLLLLALLSRRVHTQDFQATETGITDGTTLGSTSPTSSTGSQGPATSYGVLSNTAQPTDEFQSRPTTTSVQSDNVNQSDTQATTTVLSGNEQPQPFSTSIAPDDRSRPSYTTVPLGDDTQSTSTSIFPVDASQTTSANNPSVDGTQSTSTITVPGNGSQSTSTIVVPSDGSQTSSSSAGNGTQSVSTTILSGNGSRAQSGYRTVLASSGSQQTSTTVQPFPQPSSTTVQPSDGLQTKTTTVLPDVTATSQTIVLLTERSNKSSTEANTVTEPTWNLPSDNVTENATNSRSEFKSLLLTFNGSCSQQALSVVKQLDDLLAPNGTGVVAAPTDCIAQFQLRLLVSDSAPLRSLVGSTNVSLAGGVPLILIGIEELRNGDIAFDKKNTFYFLSAPLTNREVVAYSIVGAVFGLTVILVLALLCCKCCCAHGSRKTSRNIPRLAMRLEDYSLTRIPRPSTIFASRNGNAEIGRRQNADPEQSFETSVVPLDDDFGSVRHNRLRSFDGRRPRTELQHQSGSGTPARYGSNERLARESGAHRLQGTDNRVFRF